MNRRTFLQSSLATVGLVALPKLDDGYWCECRMVYYTRREGYYAASHFGGQRFTYALHRKHEQLHRRMAKTANDRNWGSFRERLAKIATRGEKINGFELQPEEDGYRFARIFVDGQKSPLTFWHPWRS